MTARRGGSYAVLLVAVVPVLVYALASLVPDGPRFVSRAECVRVASPDDESELEIVYGRFDSLAEAAPLVEKAVSVGYAEATAVADGCGRWKVVNPDVNSFAGGSDAIEEGRRAGLDGVLERAQG